MQYVAFTASTLIRGNSALVKGFAIGATSASVVNIYDGTSSAGTLVFNVNVAADSTEMFGIDGVPFNTGVYVEVASGDAIGSIFYE